MLEGADVDLCEDVYTVDGRCRLDKYLGQLIALLGPPPADMLEQERQRRTQKLDMPLINFDGACCRTVSEFWNGPYFDDKGNLRTDCCFRSETNLLIGQFLYPELVQDDLTIEDTITSLEGDEKRLFLDFLVQNMLCWDPEQRMSAKELLQHPWLKEEGLDGTQGEDSDMGYPFTWESD
jgi:serine/threonine-protein kinase SRPK3